MTVAAIARSKAEAERVVNRGEVWDGTRVRKVARWLSPVRFVKSPIEDRWRAEREAELT